MTPAIKYWVCKTGPAFVYEAMETLGGNGYVEDGPMGRIYREIPLNAIWEGSGNVMCLDVLRAADRAPDDMASVLDELTAAAAGSRELSALARDVADMTADPSGLEGRSRLFVEKLVKLAVGCLLLEHAPQAVSDGFMATRLDAGNGRIYGASQVNMDIEAILERAMPVP